MKTPTLLATTQIPVSDVILGSRLRPVSEAGVESLIASIAETQVMKDAIHVRKKKSGELVLIAGAHRLEAARRLGWTEIEAKVWSDVTDDWSRLMEVDDNLAGAEMNVLDTAIFLAERKRIYEKLHPETAAEAFKGNQHTGKLAADIMSFATATADKFGVTDRHVRRLVAIGDALSKDEVRWLRAAPKPVTIPDMQALSRIDDPHERAQICIALSNGDAKSVSVARQQRLNDAAIGDDHPEEDALEAAFKAISKAWDRAPLAAKKRFLFERAHDIWEAQNKGVRLDHWREAAE